MFSPTTLLRFSYRQLSYKSYCNALIRIKRSTVSNCKASIMMRYRKSISIFLAVVGVSHRQYLYRCLGFRHFRIRLHFSRFDQHHNIPVIYLPQTHRLNNHENVMTLIRILRFVHCCVINSYIFQSVYGFYFLMHPEKELVTDGSAHPSVTIGTIYLIAFTDPRVK